MTQNAQITLFHAPNTRSAGTLLLLKELGASFDLHVLNLRAGEQRKNAFLAINLLGKVPTLKHHDAVITEQVAIMIYLADLFPEAELAPGLGDPLRGPYLRWMVYYGSCFEPAVVDRAMKREEAASMMSPYGGYDSMLKAITDQLEKGPYFLGDRFTAADVLWGTALSWTTSFGLVEKTPLIATYLDLVNARPHFIALRLEEAALAEAQQKSAGL